MRRVNELRLIARVAQMYHVERKQQVEIAEILHISQATVSRILKRAEMEGIVRTRIIPPPGTFYDLEQTLRDHYDLDEAIVIDCSEDREGAIIGRIGEAAAYFLDVTLQKDEVIGVSSSSQLLQHIIDYIHPLKTGRVRHVVQLLGSTGGTSGQLDAAVLTTTLAKLTGGEPRLLLVQGIASSQEAKLVMLSDSLVREAIDLFGSLTLAIVEIGVFQPTEYLARFGSVVSSQEISFLRDAGAAGEVANRFFDRDGRPVETPLNERVIGISLGELRKADRVMALGGGESKTEAIAGALKLGMIDVLVTDKFTATRLIARFNS